MDVNLNKPKGTCSNLSSIMTANVDTLVNQTEEEKQLMLEERNTTDKVVASDDGIKENVVASPDEIIEDMGGCGRFQIRMSVVVHLIKTIFCFSFTNLMIFTSTTAWFCANSENYTNSTSAHIGSPVCLKLNCIETCKSENGTKCESFVFSDKLKTVNGEFNLVCDRDFIPSTISSLQLAGSLAGNVISGHVADQFGRKLPFFMSILLVLLFNFLGFFASSWQMFAVCTFFTGLGYGVFMATQYNILSEFTLAKWRTWIVGFPSWPIQQSIFALCAWLVHDWRYMQLITALMAIPCLLAWLIIPESFRWHIARNDYMKAKQVIKTVAKFNGHEHDICIDKVFSRQEKFKKQTYTFVSLFKTLAMARVTILLILNWIALGVVGYGIWFGIQALSGNIFLNLFLFSVTSIPSKTLGIFLCNKFGRRKTTILCFLIVTVAGTVIGLLHTVKHNFTFTDQMTNILAIIANTSISAAWSSVQTMTVELYPTVIRNIGFGTLSFLGGIAAVIGPQLVYFNTWLPGLLFYVCGGISCICAVGTFFLPETMDKYLKDNI